MKLKKIATIYTDFPEKFGVPRQSGLADTKGRIVFEKQFRNPDFVRGLKEFSHIWLVWGFSKNKEREITPTVRPPRLGGNTRLGVFATRSPYRPNALGLSSVKLIDIDFTSADAPVIYVEGADTVSGTPIYDIKPYLSFTDSHTDAVCGFAENTKDYSIKCEISEEIKESFPEEFLDSLKNVLENDPRPSYHDNEDRVYKMDYAGYGIEFKSDNKTIYVEKIRDAKD
jgi:tRNA-Thr(GGU) m(6)t(6)A37 methyltransferase TsaA